MIVLNDFFTSFFFFCQVIKNIIGESLAVMRFLEINLSLNNVNGPQLCV